MTDKPKKKKRKNKQAIQHPINDDTRLLASKLHFTVKDLHYNRHGVVSREQYKRLRTTILINVLWQALFFIIPGIGGIYGVYWCFTADFQAIANMRRGEAIIVSAIAITVFMGILMPLYLLYRLIKTARSMQKLNRGEVKKYVGTLEKRTHVPTAEQKENGITDRVYVLQFGHLKYVVSRREHELFKNGATYIVYYLPHHIDYYLSAELVEAVFE